MTNELELTWNGNPLEYDDDVVTRSLYGAPEIGPLAFEFRDEEFPGYGRMLAGEPVPLPRTVAFWVESRIKEETSPMCYRRAVTESNLLTGMFSPKWGEVKLQFNRFDEDDEVVARYLRVLADEAPPWAWRPQGGEDAAGVRASARIRTKVSGVARFPWFVDTEPCFDGTISASQSVQITNPGDRWVGFSLTILSNSYDGDTLRLTGSYTLNGVDVTAFVDIVFPDGSPNEAAILEYWDPAAVHGYPIGARSFLYDSGSGLWRRAVAIPQSSGWLSFPPGVPVTLTMSLSGGTTGTTLANLRVTPIYEGF